MDRVGVDMGARSETASAYLGALSRLMLDTMVTDREGGSLPLDEGTERAVELLLSVKEASRKVMLVGNGGSLAIVSHMQNDLCKAVGARAVVFSELPLLTALTNDDGYDVVYERPVKLWAESGDLMLSISSSGRSENILRAVRASLDRECKVITLSGFRPENPLREMGDLNFYVRSDVYGLVETAHAALTHFMTDRAASIVKSLSETQVGA